MKLILVWFFLVFILVFELFYSFAFSQEIIEQEFKVEDILQGDLKVSSGLTYNIQKYSGFNVLVDFIAESLIKAIFKLKTKAKNLNVDLGIYSGWNLIQKKAKSLKIEASELYLKDIPLSQFELTTFGPIYIKKFKVDSKKENRVVFPVPVNLRIKINFEEVNNVINNLPKWQSVLKEVSLPIPPFGYTEIQISDLKIDVSENGKVHVKAFLKSLAVPDSEVLELQFIGELGIENERIIVYNLESEVEDIFTKDSEMGRAFSKMLEDLINPIFKLNKYEKKGITISKASLFYEERALGLDLNLILMPPEQGQL